MAPALLAAAPRSAARPPFARTSGRPASASVQRCMTDAARSALARLAALKTPDGRPLCSAFWALPDPEAFPAYYDVITQPVCLNDVVARMDEHVERPPPGAVLATPPRAGGAASPATATPRRRRRAPAAATPKAPPSDGSAVPAWVGQPPAWERPSRRGKRSRAGAASAPAAATGSPPARRFGLADLARAIRKIVANAKRFNQPSADAYQDAVLLERAAFAVVRHITVAAGARDSRGGQGARESARTIPDHIRREHADCSARP